MHVSGIGESFWLTLQFGLDPHMTGYQQHFAVKSAGLVDFVPQALGIDYSSVRTDDDEADKVWRA